MKFFLFLSFGSFASLAVVKVNNLASKRISHVRSFSQICKRNRAHEIHFSAPIFGS
jgi:hypothetical protein